MGGKSYSAVTLVVLGLGAALVVFFAGTTAAIAAGQTPPTALWAAGSAVSGALVGLLVPAPGDSKRHDAVGELARKRLSEDKLTGDDATKATEEAVAHEVSAAITPDTTVAAWVLLGFFVVLLMLSIALAAGAITPPSGFGEEPMKNVIKVIVALASASGSALIGLYAPSSGKET